MVDYFECDCGVDGLLNINYSVVKRDCHYSEWKWKKN